MPKRRLPTEAIPELTVECVGGPRDGETLTLHDLQPVMMGDELAGYLAADNPPTTEDGAYVVTPALRLEWEPRGPEHDE